MLVLSIKRSRMVYKIVNSLRLQGGCQASGRVKLRELGYDNFPEAEAIVAEMKEGPTPDWLR